MTEFPIQKSRSVKEVLMVSLHYMLANARSLLIAVVLFSLPLLVAARLLSYIGTGYGETFNRFFIYKNTYKKNTFVSLAIAYLLNLTGICLFNLSVNRNVLSVDASKNESGQLLPNLKKDFEEDLRNFIISFLIIFAGYTSVNELIAYFSSHYAESVNPFGPGDLAFGMPFISSIVNFLPSLLLLSIGFYFFISALFICTRDKTGAVEALKKVQQHTINNLSKAWLGSALLLLIAFLANYFLSMLVYALHALTGIALIYTHAIFITNLLQTTITCIIVLYFQLAIIFLYGSIEDEVTGHFIKSKIENV